jgi:hypothetical protein
MVVFSMTEMLAFDNFNFMSREEIDNLDYMNVVENSVTGYILEVDLHYADKLHDEHNDYPLAPESLLITENMLSPFCQSFKQKHADCRKLVPNLNDKTMYVLHYKSLQLYVNLGLQVTRIRIHPVLTFSQRAWMKEYTELNTEKLKCAKNDFERDFF